MKQFFILFSFLLFSSCSNPYISPTAAPEEPPFMEGDIESNTKANKLHRVFRTLANKPVLVHSVNGKKQTPLHLASMRNRYELVEALIQAGAQLNVQDNKGNTPLHYACYSNNEESVELLIQAGADPNIKNGHMETAVHKAAVFCSKKVFELLLPLGDMEIKDRFKMTPVQVACKYQNLIFVKALVRGLVDMDNIDTYGDDPLMSCLKGLNSNEELENLLIDLAKNMNFKNNKGESYLHAAATNGKANAVKKLLAKGARVNARDTAGITPVVRAFRHRRQVVAEILIDAGADLAAKDNDGRTLLQLMSFWMDEKTVLDKFIKHIDVNAVDVKGRTAMHDIAYWGHLNNARQLLKAGAKINVQDINGQTCLYEAIRGKKYDMVELLIQNKADVNIKNSYNDTVLKQAILNEGNNLHIVELLLEAGAEVNYKNIYQETPLHEAVRVGNPALVSLMLKYKPDLSVKDKFGKTPLDWAKEKKLAKIIDLLQ